MMPAVSICIPVYNGEKYLRETIDSILAQTYRDFELVIVDNASTDSTPAIIKGFNDLRIRYVRNEKTLPCQENWNRCIELAGCPLIGLYHADDLYAPDIVAKEAAILKANPNIGVVFTEAENIDEAGKTIRYSDMPGNLKGKPALSFKELFVHLIRNNHNPLMSPTCMARKSVYAKTGLYDKNYRFVFDIDMYLRMAEVSDMAVIPERLIRYRIHKSQGSKRYACEAVGHNEIYDMYDKFIMKHRNLLTESDLGRYECFKRWDNTSHAIRALQAGDAASARKLLKGSFSKSTILTSLTDLNLFLRLCISASFKAFVFLGLGVPAARLLAGRHIGYL